MEIKINEVKDKKNYLDEALTLNSKKKNLKQNPHTKIIPYTKNTIINIITFIILSIIFLIAILISKKYFAYIILGFMIFYILLLIIYLYKAKKIIKKSVEEKTDSLIILNNKTIKFTNNNTKISLETTWEDIYLIIITKHCISFLPNDISKQMITLPIDYKEDILKEIKKYKKEDLIIYNKDK